MSDHSFPNSRSAAYNSPNLFFNVTLDLAGRGRIFLGP